MSATAGMVVSPAAGDLHLRRAPRKPSIEGIVTSNRPEDWDGSARPRGAESDVGADDFDTPAAAPQTPCNLRVIW